MDADTFRRFQAKYIVLPNGCWQWQAAKIGRGYGVLGVPSGSRLVHRLAYEHFKGAIPAGLTVDHLCKNKACVNPNHLEAVTNRVNNLRGSSFTAQNARKTHCSQGHEFTSENTYIHRGQRRCRACHRIREYQRKHRGEKSA